MDNFGLYAILTNPQVSYKKFAECCVEEKITFLQLREKFKPDREVIEICLQLKEVIKGSETKLVINDRPDIAMFCHLDGFHLGQDDLPFSLIPKEVRIQHVIGLSTHNIEQAEKAVLQNPDYIGFGPVYKTPTKAVPDPETGTRPVDKILKLANCPVVFIGGLFPENIEPLIKCGAENFCLVRYFMETKNPEIRIREIKNIIKKGVIHDSN